MSSEIDDLDRRIIHVLTLDARLPFAEVATVLGVSEQTVSRRYQRLAREGIFRCAILLDPYVAGNLDHWILRITPKPGSSASLAKELTRHRDISWVFVSAEEIVCVLTARAEADWETMLTERLPKTSLVRSVSALHVIRGFPLLKAWPDFSELLDDQQKRKLAHIIGNVVRPSDSSSRNGRFDRVDHAIFEVLSRDARATYTELAHVISVPRNRIRSRLEELLACGALYFSPEYSARTFGFEISAGIFARVSPRLVEAVRTQLGEYPNVSYVSVTTGSTNLFASVNCRDMREFYRFCTSDLGEISGLDDVEVVTIIRQYKYGLSAVKPVV